jgi:hypothetical protein
MTIAYDWRVSARTRQSGPLVLCCLPSVPHCSYAGIAMIPRRFVGSGSPCPSYASLRIGHCYDLAPRSKGITFLFLSLIFFFF